MLGVCCSPARKTAVNPPHTGSGVVEAAPAAPVTVSTAPPERQVPKSSPRTDAFLEKLLGKYPAYFDSVLKNRDSLDVQVIYTQIDRGRNNFPAFRDYYFNVDPSRYFYPASTVKLPVTLLALQRLNELNLPGLDWNTTLLTDSAYEGETVVLNDPTSRDGRPSVGQYIKKVFLTSDNDAFNRLYEWLGPTYINAQLHQRDYADVQIRHRLDVVLREDQNRNVNPVRFLNASNQSILDVPARADTTTYAQRTDTIDGVDFSRKNQISLTDLHRILRSALFPESVPERERFNIGADGYKMLYRTMSELPGETRYPAYDSTEIWDTYVKYLLFGSRKVPVPKNIRVFNKIGEAYGFLMDVAYVIDTSNDVEFMLSAVIRCNPDGHLGDEHYTYEGVGLPFLQHLGEVIYRYELQRSRKYKPDLSAFQFTYDR